MEKKRKIIIAVILLLSIGNFIRLTNNENIRPIQFISIFVIGALTALLINEFFTLFIAKRQQKQFDSAEKLTLTKEFCAIGAGR